MYKLGKTLGTGGEGHLPACCLTSHLWGLCRTSCGSNSPSATASAACELLSTTRFTAVHSPATEVPRPPAGFSVVKLATEKETGAHFACKIMALPAIGSRTGDGESTREDIFKEIEILVGLNNVNVVYLKEYFQEAEKVRPQRDYRHSVWGLFEARPCWRRGAGPGLPSSWVRTLPRETTPLRIPAPQVHLIMELLRSGKLLAAVLTNVSRDSITKAAR